MTSVGTISGASLHVGTPALRDAVTGLLSRTLTRAHVDAFRIDDEQVVTQLMALRDRNVALSVLADTDNATGRMVRELRDAATAGWHELGADPLKQHGKSVSRDGGAEALVATDIADGDAHSRIEFAASFSGPASQALHAVHLSSDAQAHALQDVLERAAREGIAINEPRVQARHATDAIESVIREPSQRLQVMTKSFDSESLADDLAHAARDRDVAVITHDIPRSQRRLLDAAGVDVRLIDEGRAERAGTALHGTLIDAGDRALITSAYLEDRVLFGSRGRQSREVAAVMDGAAVQHARDALKYVVDAQP